MGDYRVVGWDSEADRRGNIYLICNSSRQESALIAPRGQTLTTKEILEFLWGHGRDNNGLQTVNVIHNLDYDVRGFLKPYLLSLPKDKRKELVRRRKFRLGRFLVRWRPHKYFMISVEGKQARFFDTHEHLKGSLESLSQKLLGEGKGVSADFDIKAGREKYSDKILVEYCRRDAVLTGKLMSLWIETVLPIVQSSKIWTGPARLAEEIMRRNTPSSVLHPFKNTARDRSVLIYFYRAFFGGRYDLAVKGRVSDAFEQDVSSMYPAFIRDLVALNTGEWKYGGEYHPEAVYGAYHINTEFLNGILPYRTRRGLILYPHLRGQRREAYVVKCELEALIEAGTDFEILDAFEYFTPVRVYPFRDLIDSLYRAKTEAGKKGEEAKRTAYKTIMNSLYGKTAQAKGGLGALFNPIFCSEITARGRLQILKLAKEWFSEVYEIKTDAVVGRPKDPRLLKFIALANSHFADVAGRNLWQILFAGKLGAFVPKPNQYPNRIMIQTGITLKPEEGKTLKDGLEFIHYRGFSVKGKKIETKPESIVVWTERPVGMAEAVIQGREEEINEFKPHRKELSIYDHKRIWRDLTTERLENEKIVGEVIDGPYLDALEEAESTLGSRGVGTGFFAWLFEAERTSRPRAKSLM